MTYPELYRWVYSRRGLLRALAIADKLAVIYVAAVYILSLVLAYIASWILLLQLLAFSFFPFVALSIFRRLVNSPRPYEVYDFASLGLDAPKGKGGSSFPSRHVFSAFLIGSLVWLIVSPVLGAGVIVLGAVIAIARVLCGRHFVRDVVAGALVGGIAGLTGALLIIYGVLV